MDADAPTVAVVGSYNADLVVDVPRFPVPGETVTGGGFAESSGGKGSNQAVAVARLDAGSRFVGCVGHDRRGATAFDLWDREGVDAAGVRRADVPTGVAVVLVDETGENEIVVVPGANHALDPESVRDAVDAVASADVVLVQLEIPDGAVEAAVDVAADAGVPVVLNPAPARDLPGAVVSRVRYLTPNRMEGRALAGFAPDADVADETVARRLRSFGADAVVLTRGEDGALVDDGRTTTSVPALDVDTVDTTGAGDAFNAAFAVGIAEGRSVVEATRFGCAAGSLAVTTADVVPSLPGREAVDGRL